LADEDLDLLRANAWTGAAVKAPVDAHTLKWGGRRNVGKMLQTLAPARNLDNWMDPTVGWGVVLRDRDDMKPADKAQGLDAPRPIRDLLKHRGDAPVLRYRPDLGEGKLRRYGADGAARDLNPRGKRGVQDDAVPWYLLIVGTPKDVPWSLQYRLNTDAFVGRLDLDPDGLERYVNALMEEWAGTPRNVKKPVIWSVDHGHPDITRLMRKIVAEKLLAEFANDAGREFDMKDGFLSDGKGTHGNLLDALAARQPALVVTTSHGATYPLKRPEVMSGNLGRLVDRDQVLADPAALAKEWNGLGAIWYAHACCSAGCDTVSKFEGIVEGTSVLGETLTGIGMCGAQTAPMPKALLGGVNPLGAFIGHVEPTFNWTLRDPTNGQATTQHIVNALYYKLHDASRPPVGRAMHSFYNSVAGFLLDYETAMRAVDKHAEGAERMAARAKLMAFDSLSMVVLGDPTVRMPG
jgi:hypothetical protein